jgi:hypothetical protein
LQTRTPCYKRTIQANLEQVAFPVFGDERRIHDQ